jgi:hypothetical protein
MNNSVAFSTFHNVMQPIRPSSSKTFHQPQNRTPIPLVSLLTTLLSATTDLPILDISHGWTHTLRDLLYVILSLGITFSRYSHTVACLRILFLFRSKGIPLYG